jgi:hypothetical protein
MTTRRKGSKRLTLNKKTSRDLRTRATGPVGGRKAIATIETCKCLVIERRAP